MQSFFCKDNAVLEGYAGVQEELPEPREQLSDGIRKINKDPTITEKELTRIALVRTGILLLVIGVGLFGLYLLRNTTIEETASRSDVRLVLDLCRPEGPKLTGTGTTDHGFVGLIGEKERKIISFSPSGPAAEALDLQDLKYYESEEQLAGGSARSIGLSFGLFRANELEFKVSICEGNDGECVTKVAKERGIEVTEPLQFFGEAVANVLNEAGRREPHNFLMTTPRVHGSLLLASGSNVVWSTAGGMFMGTYEPSDAWKAYRAITITLRVCLSAAFVLLFGRFVHNEWRKALAIWVVQYDYLWQDETIRAQALHPAPKGAEKSLARGMSLNLDGQVTHKRNSRHIFSEAAQACSSFFVLDHLVGDPQSNAEGMLLGASSALVHGMVSLVMGVLPVVHGLFFESWKAVSFILVGVYLLDTMIFGTMYYHSVSYTYRKNFLKLHLLLAGLCYVYLSTYLVSVVLFLLTRLITDTEQAVGFVAAIASVILYVAFAGRWLYKMREGVIQQLSGKESRGVIIRFLKFLGLDNKTILLTLASTIIILLLLASMLLLANKIYFESSDVGQWLAAAVTPFSALVGMIAQIQSKQGEFEVVAGDVQSAVLDVL